MSSNRIYLLSISRWLLPALLLFVFSGFASAGALVDGDVTIHIVGMAGEVTMTDEVVISVNPDGSYVHRDVPTSNSMWEGELGAWGNIDPFTNLAFSVTNIMAVPVAFTISVTTPIAPIVIGTLHGGSTGGSITDANNSGSGGLSTIGGGVPYYAGQIDGATVLSIYPDPTSFSFIFAGQTITIPALNPGLPGPTLPSGPALATIGIVHNFILSPGDTAAGTSFFIVEPVPEPSSIALAVMGGVGLCLWIRRRRRSA